MAVQTTKTIQSITITPGSTVYIPKNAKVIGYSANGDANISSTCLDLSNVESIVCYSLSYSVTDNGGSATQAWDNHGRVNTITSFNIGGVEYPINLSIYAITDIVTSIQSQIPSNLLFAVVPFSISSSDYYKNGFTFKTLPSIASTMYLETTDVEGVSLAQIYPITIDCPDSV